MGKAQCGTTASREAEKPRLAVTLTGAGDPLPHASWETLMRRQSPARGGLAPRRDIVEKRSPTVPRARGIGPAQAVSAGGTTLMSRRRARRGEEWHAPWSQGVSLSAYPGY